MKIYSKGRKVETAIKDELLIKKRRERIIRVAGKVFAQKGYHQATIKDICKASGLAPGTIYNYVKKKEDILYLIYNKVVTILSETLILIIKKKKDPLEELKEALRETIEIVCDNKELVLLMYQEASSLDKDSLYNVLNRQSNYASLIEGILKRGREKGIIKNNNPLTADIIVYLISFIPLRRWKLKKQFSEKELKSWLIDFILKALCITKVEKY